MPINPELLKRHLNPVFVETGCFEGCGILYALEAGFSRIYSIELNEYCWADCRAKFADNPQVHVVLGDSATSLWPTIQPIEDRITFFLDAHLLHWQASRSPLMAELCMIGLHPVRRHTILIDDVRMFGEDWHTPWTLGQIKAAILRINPRYEFALATGIKEYPNDILIAEVS